MIAPAPGVCPRARLSRRGGFALLITLTLLAFLVLLLVSLASLTRVETQVAGNTRQLAQARQNALMALNIALGQLQKFTGPDQRTTVRADMNSAWANPAAVTVNGRWVGAYGNGVPVDTTYGLKPSQIPADIIAGSDAKGSQAKLLNWLVSGNEGTAFDPAPSAASAANVGAGGHIVIAPASFAYTPSSTINLATANASPEAADSQVLLVGAGSASAQGDYVAAPLVPINATAGTVPGMTTAEPIGRYAWWVGDEGAKARVNLPMATAAQAPAAFVSAQRAAIELVDGKNAAGGTTATDLVGTAAYDPALATLSNLVSPTQLSMLTPAAAATLPSALRLRFHDLTAASSSVMSDTYAGGLRKDLSAVLATGAASPADSTHLFPPDNDEVTDSFGVPTWGMLRSFARTTSPAGGLDPQLPDATHIGVSPVLTYAALGLQYAAPAGDAEGNPLRLALFPLVVLWNPYTTTLKSARYEFGFTRLYGGVAQLQVAKPGTASTWTVKETVDLNRAGAPITGGKVNTDGSANEDSVAVGTRTGTADSYFRFVITTPEAGIPPGASLIFTLMGSESGRDYSAPSNGGPKNELTHGLNVGGHVLLNNGTVIGPGESGADFRVGVYGVKGANRTLFSPAPAGSNMSGGEACAYIGEVVSTSPVLAASPGYMPDSDNTQKWYHSVGRTHPARDANNLVNGQIAILQGPAPITGVTQPTSVISIAKKFSATNARWIAQNNPRALIATRTYIDADTPSYEAGGGVETPWQSFTSDSTDKRASAGLALDATTDVTDVTLFEFRPASQPLISLGQLQHANLSLLNSYPAYPVGNSLADYHFPGQREQVRRTFATSTLITSFYDMSWLLNRMLWDRYFVSTVPHAGTGASTDSDTTPIPATLPNPRMVRCGTPSDAALRDADRAATGLLLAGGFNINSTSEQAWRAVLGGINRLAYDPVGATAGGALPSALPRFARPTAAGNAASAAWQGYRHLDNAQLDQLAKNIVAEIRIRGPFVSLADFINRRLVDSAATTDDERLKGVIQAAIDATVIGATAPNTATAPFDDAHAYSSNGNRYDVDAMRGGAKSVAPYSAPSAFAPQFLTQADVLSAIGAGLSARSDTFAIRTYGETVNPVTSVIQGRAWCEAIVQRLPEYLDSISDADAHVSPTAAINKSMGRRYTIISFRWLSSNDI